MSPTYAPHFGRATLQLGDGNQTPTSSANDAQFVHYVFLQEVYAHAQRFGGLSLAQR